MFSQKSTFFSEGKKKKKIKGGSLPFHKHLICDHNDTLFFQGLKYQIRGDVWTFSLDLEASTAEEAQNQPPLMLKSERARVSNRRACTQTLNDGAPCYMMDCTT